MSSLPTVVTTAGLQPQTPAALRAQLLASVAQTNPGYTANLPGSLIEDISSTDVGAITLIDSARVESVNDLSPYASNDFLLLQLGAIYGVSPGDVTNTSVSVVFSGPPGLVIAKGYTIGDGTYQYVLKDGGVIGSGGQSSPLFAVATTPGSWTISPNTVSNLVTSPPPNLSPPLTVTNPLAGTPGGDAETQESFRSRVLVAGLAASQGMGSFLRTLLGEVDGVQPRLISVQQQSGGGWIIIVGGGDPYEVAYAIYTALFDVSTLVGATLNVVSITQAANGVVATDLNHNYTTGQIAAISGAQGMLAVNGVPITVTVLTEKTFSTGIDTSGYPPYTGGGKVSPVLRNVVVTLSDYPDVYTVEFVTPPQQIVSMQVTWNTSAVNFVSSASVAQLGAPALADYVNSITVGSPINLFELQTVFQAAIASVVSPQLLTRMVFAVSINGVSVPPGSGTGIIAGDPQSYFLTSTPQISIVQG